MINDDIYIYTLPMIDLIGFNWTQWDTIIHKKCIKMG